MNQLNYKHFWVMLLSIITIQFSYGQEKIFLKGYTDYINGDIMPYKSPQEDANQAMLVRCTEGKNEMEWEAEAVPTSFNGEYVEYGVIMGVDIDRAQYEFDFYINDKKYFTFKAPEESILQDVKAEGPNGSQLTFKGTMIDAYSDMFGYGFLKIKAEDLPKGQPVKMKVVAPSIGKSSWFMMFKYGVDGNVSWKQEPAVIKSAKGPQQQLRTTILHYGDPVKATITAGKSKEKVTLNVGANVFRINIPKIEETTSVPVKVTVGKTILDEQTLEVDPVKPYTVYLLHHSHVDIGYTHTQDEVEKMQWDNLDDAVMMSQKTADYPEGSQFKWSVEVMWAVESYLKNTTPEKRKAFMEAVKNGSIELNGLYGNMLTGLSNPQELVESTFDALQVANETDTNLESAMITDVPGYTWGLVPVLAHSGVKYLSAGTNVFHRIGGTISTWGDRPFYWSSPSGEEKVMVWVHEKGYSHFHTGLGFTDLKVLLTPKSVFDYLNELNERTYPYDITTLRYTVGSDNGPVDQGISETVKEWNDTYETPKVMLSTTTESFKAFEEKYGDQLPVVKGDFTPYWEDGAGSTSAETALVRNASEKLSQAMTIMSLNGADIPNATFEQAWRYVLLYNEHTWGAYNSISEPEADFVHSQWAVKQSFAIKADSIADELLERALAIGEKTKGILLTNTLNWDRSELVKLSAEKTSNGDYITDQDGKYYPTQRLSNGELAVYVDHLPAYGQLELFSTAEMKCSKECKKCKDCKNCKKCKGQKALKVADNTIENDFIKLEINAENGSVASLFDKVRKKELSDNTELKGLNDYYYVAGRNPKAPLTTSNDIQIKWLEKGDLVSIIEVSSSAPGTEEWKRTFEVNAYSEVVEIDNQINKTNVYDPEGVHIAFPFNVNNGTVRIDAPFGEYIPEKEQLQGSCKNYFTVQRYADVSNLDHGVTWVTPDAPMIELGEITTDALSYGWIQEVKPTQTIYAYLMNNYWETNYKASQEGWHSFRFMLRPHGAYVSTDAKKFSMAVAQPVLISENANDNYTAFIQPTANDLIITASRPMDQEHVLLTVLNANAGDSVLEWTSSDKVEEVYLSNINGDNMGSFQQGENIPGWGVRFLLVKVNGESASR
ncbi:glycoside hydrolase family 38 C-terminal domain-containing protein [Flammeovirga sp. OC4]|uniref:glycoside hydrolase family 38 N-terminal domain-containing protein n=1 Tax=Flammeovirga sp. OC4 TaxID=1382345 RepID=UPI0005C5712F|nr:glycoside hydrolase family 38 C-terminal domain-containing protein [Flammeovirga sp. OC4]